MTAAQIEHLQRSAGNAAVTRLVQRRGLGPWGSSLLVAGGYIGGVPGALLGAAVGSAIDYVRAPAAPQAALAPGRQPAAAGVGHQPRPGPAAAPAVSPEQLAARLRDQRDRINDCRRALPGGFWGLGGGTPEVEEEAARISSYLAGHVQAGLGTDADADHRLIALAAAVRRTHAAIVARDARLALVIDLYRQHAVPHGLPTLDAGVWTPLLGQPTGVPDVGALDANLAMAERGFAADLPGGFAGLSDALKRQRFVWMWKLGSVGPATRTGVSAVYESGYDTKRDRFGVEWKLQGALPGWVLHGHGRLVRDEGIVTSFELPSLHIKPADQVMALGVSVEIDDDDVKGDLITRSKGHVVKLASNWHRKETFESHTKRK